MRSFLSPIIVLLLATSFFLTACSDNDSVLPQQTVTVSSPLPEGPVGVIAAGHWSRGVACSGFCINEYNFWVDIAVRNDAFHKQVGILWTDNGWASINTTWAQYENQLEDGYEQWGIDISATTGQHRPREIEVAAFVTMNDTTYWDPKNNTYIYSNVSPDSPIKMLYSNVTYEENLGAVLEGTIRVYDLAFEKHVTVRYSTDGWETFDEQEAEWAENQDWVFRIEGFGLESLPDTLEYAIRYDVDGQEFWDNNNDQNFRHTLEPVFVPQPGYFSHDLDWSLSGIITFYAGFNTDIPIDNISARVDDGDWQEGTSLVFSTQDLEDGAHQAEYKVTLVGGYEAFGAMDFNVHNQIEPLDVWVPDVPFSGASPSAWDVAVDSESRVYVVAYEEPQIYRFDSYGTDAEPLAFEDVTRVHSITVCEQDYLYAVSSYRGSRLTRFTLDGELDSGFGDQGHISLETSFDGEELCYAGSLACNAEHIYLLDTCNERVIRFNTQGTFDGALNLPDNDWTIPSGIYRDEDGLWVLQARTFHKILDSTDGPMTIENSVTLSDDYNFNSAQGLVRSSDGNFWAGNAAGSLVTFDENGNILASILGGRGAIDLNGAFHLPQGVILVDDSSVAILGAEGARLARFSTTLR